MKLLVMAGLAAAAIAGPSAARAQIYDSYAAWAAAVQNIQPGPSGPTLVTEHVFTSTALGNCTFSISGPSIVVTDASFVAMSFPGNCNEAPGATDMAALEADFVFPFDTFFGIVVDGPDVRLNGVDVGDSTIGVVGMSNLDFTVSEATDNGDAVSVGTLLVASPRAVPEPPAWLLFGAGIVGLGLAHRRRG